jgi:hypothetical protein
MDRLDDCSPSNFASYIDPDEIPVETPYYCGRFCLALVPGSFGFALGLPLGLFCSMWVIASSRDPEAQN